MKRHALLILAMLSAPLAQAQIFGPSGRVYPAVFRAAAPAPGPANAPIYTPTTTVLGAAIGGVIAGDNKTAQGAALGGALGLVIGQVIDRRAQKRQAGVARQLKDPNAPVAIPPAEAPGAPAPIPVIDPVTGLPILGGAAPQLRPIPAESLPMPIPPRNPLQPANKLFGR